MASRTLLQRLDWVGGEVIGEKVDQEAHKQGPAINVDGDLQWGVALEERFHDFS